MSVKDFLKGQQYSGPKRATGPRVEFYKKVRGTKGNLGRLFLLGTDADGDPMMCYQYFNHRQGPKESEICAKTFDPEADCKICNDVSLLYDAENNKEAGQLRAKTESWFCFIPRGAGYSEEDYEIMQLPAGATQKLWNAIATVGGWTDEEPDFNDEAFSKAFDKGLPSCFGEKARDLSFKFNPGGAPAKTYSSFKFSAKAAKKLTPSMESAPDFERIFRAVKKVQSPDEPVKRKPSVKKTAKKGKK